jgi:hypothetical protein
MSREQYVTLTLVTLPEAMYMLVFLVCDLYTSLYFLVFAKLWPRSEYRSSIQMIPKRLTYSFENILDETV